MALAGRAFVQAQKFGAEIMIPVTVNAARLHAHGRHLRAAISTMAAHPCARDPSWSRAARAIGGRRSTISEQFEGRGVWYWASPIEARLCADEEVMLVGGGNSAGQAAVFLAAHAAKVLMVRGDGLAASMSRYLIDRIEATPNIELIRTPKWSRCRPAERRAASACAGATGVGGRNRHGAIRNLFLFVGADPATDWLDGLRRRRSTARGFVVTGGASRSRKIGRQRRCSPASPACSRSATCAPGSVKRVGGAIGEGAQVVAALHGFLGDAQRPPL